GSAGSAIATGSVSRLKSRSTSTGPEPRGSTARAAISWRHHPDDRDAENRASDLAFELHRAGDGGDSLNRSAALSLGHSFQSQHGRRIHKPPPAGMSRAHPSDAQPRRATTKPAASQPASGQAVRTRYDSPTSMTNTTGRLALTTTPMWYSGRISCTLASQNGN